MELELRINGVVESLDVATNESLLHMLRREGYNSVKSGCETGECGACTVLVDGVPRPSCTMLAAQAGGCTLMTVESLRSGRQLHPLQLTFTEVGAVQCGFCTPGMLLSAHALLQHNPNPSETDVRIALAGQLCRCTGYLKPVQAVMRAATIMRGENVLPLETSNKDEGNSIQITPTGKLRTVTTQGISSTTGKLSIIGTGSLSATRAEPVLQVVGKATPAIDAIKLATGSAAFTEDTHPREMLYGRVLTSPHAHAVIRSIDVSDAKALAGVYAVLTYKDVPRVAYSSIERTTENEGPHDTYCLDYIVRHVGDRVAVVAAETPEIAEQALRLIRVDYDLRPALLDTRQALESTAQHIHAEAESFGIADAQHNIAARVRNEIGNVENGFAEADVVVEGEYILPQTQPAPLEKHVVVTMIDDDGYLVVRSSSSVPHHIQRVLATLLGLPAHRIRVIQPNIGGDFGVKQEIVLEDVCSLLTIMTNRPVMLTYTRRETFNSHVRQSQIIRVKTGVRHDGTLIAQQMTVLANTGAYGTHPLTTKSDFAAQALGLYPCQHMRFVAEVVYTNTPPSGAFRGYGMPEASFALESHMDEVARRLNMDALELRRKNWIIAGHALVMAEQADKQAAPINSCGLAPCLTLVEEQLHWRERRERRGHGGNGRLRKGVGIALALHHDSEECISGAMMKLNEDGSCDLFAPITGGGSSATLLVQIAAETLGLSVENIHLHSAETSLIPASFGSSILSRFYSNSGAVRRAAQQLRQQILIVAAQILHVQPDTMKLQAGIITAGQQSITIAQAVMYALQIEHHHLMATSSWQQQTPITFAAHGAEIEVDTETGTIRVLKLISAVDAGRVLNPILAEGEIQGQIAQALGMTLSEELLYNPQGLPTNTTFGSYHLINAAEMPEMHTYLVETDEPTGPFGAKSVTAIGLSGIAAAIANAVADALSMPMHQLPLTSERVLRAVHAQTAKK